MLTYIHGFTDTHTIHTMHTIPYGHMGSIRPLYGFMDTSNNTIAYPTYRISYGIHKSTRWLYEYITYHAYDP